MPTSTVDVRPNRVDAIFHPGDAFSIVLDYDIALTGRTFTAAAGASEPSGSFGVTPTVTVTEATGLITVAFSAAQSTTLSTTASWWKVTETTGGVSLVRWIGKTVPDAHGSGSTTTTVTVNTSASTVTVTTAAGTSVQPYDADLVTIAALSPSNDDVLQRKSGAWTNRTPAQLATDLQTSALDDAYVPMTSLAPAPTGVDDTAALIAWLAADGGSGAVLYMQPGTYLVTLSQNGLPIPDGTTLVIPPWTTVKAIDNVATGAGTYIMFGPVSGTPTDITLCGGGLIDGNRRGGNHGASEIIFGAAFTDALRVTVEGLRFYNWRGEAVYFGHDTLATPPTSCRFIGNRVEDVGVPVSGDANTFQRQGVSFIAGTDIFVAFNDFDTIGGYAVDFEGNDTDDHFDNIVIGPNTYRDCAQGFYNITTPGSVNNVRVLDRGGAGATTIGSQPQVIPSANRRTLSLRRSSGDLTLNPGNTNWNDIGTIADFVMKDCRPGDIVEVGLSSAWDAASTFRNLDVASIVSGAPVTYWGTGSGTPVSGVSAWRGFSSTARPFGGSVMHTLVATDIDSNRTLTLRFRYKFNSAVSSVLTASAPHLQAWVKNHGPGI